MRIVFIGSGAFAVPALRSLLDAGHDIVCVCSQPARPAGRGRRPRDTAVAAYAGDAGLEVRCPREPGCPEFLTELTELAPDIGVLADFARLLPASVLEAPTNGFLNIHPSLLPRWRGAAPVQRAILAGDDITGVCIMQMNETLDRGPVLMMRRMNILPDDTAAALAARLAEMGAGMIVKAAANIAALRPIELDQSQDCYARKIGKDEARIDWRQPAEKVDRRIRGLSPNPGAWGMIRSERIKLLGSQCEAGAGAPGEVLDSELLVACGGGAVRPTRLQRQGRSPLDLSEFLRGYTVKPGERFES